MPAYNASFDEAARGAGIVQVTFLGTAQDAGVPQIGCACGHCQAAIEEPSRARTAVSLAIEKDGQTLLLETSPDIRAQWPRIPGQVIAIAWTHAHMGHVAGAAQLGMEGPDLRVPGIGTPSLLEHVRQAAPHLRLDWRPLQADAATTVGPFEVRFHAIRHRAETSDTVAIEVRAGGTVLFLPDTDAWDEAVEAAVAGLGPGDLLVFDATFFSPDEVRHRDVTKIPHPFVQDTLPRLQALAQAGVQVVLSHLNHTNPLCGPRSPASKEVARAGLLVADDGDRFHLHA